MKRLLAFAILLFLALPGVARGQVLELNKGDHICIIGNTLAERMQHDGWLEAVLVARFPEHDLTFRNLGFSGDELTVRLRSMDFGQPDEWLSANGSHPQMNKIKNAPDKSLQENPNRFALTNTKADVIFAFFGYNESKQGAAGLDKFKRDLDSTLKGMLGKQYNGKSAPRIVVFSPVAHEDLKNPNLPDGREDNERIKLYTTAMAEVSKANNVAFVDLFTPTLASYAESKTPWTFNGIHMTQAGNQRLASVIEYGLFGSQKKASAETLEKIRSAVNDKNFYWFHRYRAVDGYSTYGDRAFLAFTGGQTNYEVLFRELQALDVMTSNRDQRVWAVAKGKDLKVDDGNRPQYLPVVTNRPGAGPNGAHLFLTGEESVKNFKVHKGMKVNLYASEEQFPEIAKAVQMAWDTKGRLWLACMPSYPHWKPGDKMSDKIVILEDTDGDGRADKSKVFADDLHVPTGLELYAGGVLVGQQPDILFLKDTDGDDRADVRERVLHGLDSADTHHASNSFTFDPGGALYFQEGTFHQTQVETPFESPVRCSNAGVFRYEPRSHKFGVYVSYGFANPHGHVFDRWGQDIVTDGTGNVNYLGTAFSGHLDYPDKHGGLSPIFQQRTRPCGGTEILSSRHFPDELQGNFLNCNVIGVLAVLQYKLEEKDSGLVGTEVDPIVQSTDANFRPVDCEIGPDGAIYLVDWQNPIIGHMQHNLRDPSRDQKHGRVYRVTYEGRPLLKPAKIAGEPIEKLLDLLKEPENRVRYRAKIELSGRPSDAVIAATRKWIEGLNKSDPQYQHQLLEALWVHQWHNVVDEGLLKRLLESPDYHARAAATRVLCYWRDRVKEPLALLQARINDEHPRARLEAIRALSFFRGAEAKQAQEILAEALLHPDDTYIKYTFKETTRALERQAK